MNDRAFDVSVVIPTYKRPDLLQRCLEPLLKQTLPADRYEIIVVDDGQTEDTRALVENLAAATQGRPLLRYLRPEGTRGPAAARNRGWRAAQGEVVAFTDDDTIPDVNWLHYGWLAMSNGQAAVRGAVHVPIEGPLTDHGRMTQGLEKAEFVTANCFVRRSALQAVDGFDERFLRAWREDSDLHFKLIEAYGEVPKASLAVVQHPVREAPFGISIKQQANMMFDALLFKKHPELYRAKVGRVHAPPSYYLVVIGTLLAPLLALAGAGTLALTLLALAVGLVLWLTFKRLRGTSRSREHITEMLVTSAAIPFLSLYWRIKGALRFRVPFF
ncbi:glycosyltransferase family 2 protein [Ideonella sp. BN130291]|uniref:glycosyltransferase family 2 protein n=1 Tax=Ideonella sp. BN130291 TaxID=3112940 RepID=UPI002E25B0DB|nr:glycosyltransferase [Ideonella sp. BN130291]